METMNIALSAEMKEFVRLEVQAGGYSSVSEYIRDLIRRAQGQKAENELEGFVLEGLSSGPATEMTRADWDALRARARRTPSPKRGKSRAR